MQNQNQTDNRRSALDAAVRLLAPTLSDWRPVTAKTVETGDQFLEGITLRLAAKFEQYLNDGTKIG